MLKISLSCVEYGRYRHFISAVMCRPHPVEMVISGVEHIQRNTHLSDTPFYIENDRMLDKPVKYTKWFTDTIVENWELYKSLMSATWLPKMKYSNGFSYKHDAQSSVIMKFSSFCEELSKMRWIIWTMMKKCIHWRIL